MFQRAFVHHSTSALPHVSKRGVPVVIRQFAKLIITCISLTFSSRPDLFRGNAHRFNPSLVVLSKLKRFFSTALFRAFMGDLFRSISTIPVVTFQFLPLLSLLSLKVSEISDKQKQRFLLCSIHLKEALKATGSLRPIGRNNFEKLAFILLDRNHFLVLVNGRSPP